MFDELMGKNFINVPSQASVAGYEHGYVTKELLSRYISADGQYFYLCGPEPIIEAVEAQLAILDVPNEFIVKESF